MINRSGSSGSTKSTCLDLDTGLVPRTPNTSEFQRGMKKAPKVKFVASWLAIWVFASGIGGVVALIVLVLVGAMEPRRNLYSMGTGIVGCLIAGSILEFLESLVYRRLVDLSSVLKPCIATGLGLATSWILIQVAYSPIDQSASGFFVFPSRWSPLTFACVGLLSGFLIASIRTLALGRGSRWGNLKSILLSTLSWCAAAALLTVFLRPGVSVLARDLFIIWSCMGLAELSRGLEFQQVRRQVPKAST